MQNNFHPFHMISISPWPLTSALSLLFILSGTLDLINFDSFYLMTIGLTSIILTSIQWWRDVIRESTFQGNHTSIVVMGLREGMILFIISEVFFFLSFFWAFFHSSLSPSIELGLQWPPISIYPFNPFSIPLLNTLILISSGVTITWAHHSLLNNSKFKSIISLLVTVMLGVYFSFLQGWEYFSAPFSISDSIYGATFFVTTGFHGFHVLIGSTFLFICLIRLYKNHFSFSHHMGYEAAIWYWHFVDIVWLFLYTFMYWWSY
uniref:Cytochrome c oxidase subunit 3 n=1 Tax=Anoplodactylus australis TaxID=2992006 RepID=A0A9E7V792_9CHEL|nr:cytochrome c oxidase subunit 3 [Anoplodactylus australis]UZA61240.1 cytochrome c oxidase subunit 3 [Anoplodactylus australis]